MSEWVIHREYVEGVIITVEADSKEEALELLDEWGELPYDDPQLISVHNDGDGTCARDIISIHEKENANEE